MISKNLIFPIVCILSGVGCWAGGNLLEDKVSGKELAIALISGGVGYAQRQLKEE